MINAEIISQILMLVGVLVILVNIITEVVKNVFEMKEAKEINIFVTVLSVALTVLVLLAYCQIKAITLTWYIAISFIVIGFMVSYAAMFGYDKLLSYFEKIRVNK